MTYNRFIQGLKAAGVEVDRKVLADLAVNDAPAFAALVEVAKAALPADVDAQGRVRRLAAPSSDARPPASTWAPDARLSRSTRWSPVRS